MWMLSLFGAALMYCSTYYGGRWIFDRYTKEEAMNNDLSHEEKERIRIDHQTRNEATIHQIMKSMTQEQALVSARLEALLLAGFPELMDQLKADGDESRRRAVAVLSQHAPDLASDEFAISLIAGFSLSQGTQP